jgi:L-fuconate dehydratase
MQSGAKPRDIADALAEAKALKISRKQPTVMVLGCDQILLSADGKIFDKPENKDEARAHLAALSGASHRLISAAVICEQGKPVWRLVGEMSPEEFVASVDFRYLADALTEPQALELLRARLPGKPDRIARLLDAGYPSYTTSAGWLGYSDEALREKCRDLKATISDWRWRCAARRGCGRSDGESLRPPRGCSAACRWQGR